MDDPRSDLFRVFNEIGIINQLATALLARRLPDGVHPSQFALLGNLARLGDAKTPAALAQAFQVPKASMTNTLMQLQRRDLIDVRPHADDLRKKVVFLTPKGRDLYNDTVKNLGEDLHTVTEDVEGLTGILPTLESLRTTLDARREG